MPQPTPFRLAIPRWILLVTFLAASPAWSATGWYDDYLALDTGNGDAWFWIGSDPGSNTELDGHDLGTVRELSLTVIEMKYWSDTQDRTGGSFWYKIDDGDSHEIIWSHSALGGNNFQGDWSGESNLVSGVTPGAHQLNVWAKSWGSGQGDSWLSNGGMNYVADFFLADWLVTPDNGPYGGGNVVTVTNIVPAVGDGSDITNILVGTSGTTNIVGQGTNWVAFIAPAAESAGAKDLVVQSASLGDFTIQDAYTYNPAGDINRIEYDTNNWEVLSAPLTTYAEFPAMAVYSNALYLIGGKGLTNVYRYSYTNATWTEVEGLPHPIYGAVAGSVAGHLYLAGGMNAAGSAVTNQLYRFDGTSWTRAGEMDYPRCLAAGAVVNGKLHIMGGMDEVGGLPTTSVVFDGTNWLSQSFGTVFGLRIGAAAVGTNVYVSGGYYGGYQIYYHRLFITNDLNQMAYGSQTFMPNGRAYHASAALDDNVYIIGGRVGGTATAGSWCYNYTNRLADPPDMPQALDSIAAATYRGSIYVTGGSTLNNTTNVYRYPAQSGSEGVVPDSGVRNGGYQVTIIGSNLGSGADITNVTLCGVSAASIVSQSATQVVITAGASLSDTTGAVRVYSTSYGMTELEDAFTYEGTGKDQQTITFAPIANQTRSSVVRLSATASSGLPVTFSVVSGPASLSGGTNLSFTSEGAVSVMAAQAGDETYDPAPDVTRSFFVTKAFSFRAVALTNSVVLRWNSPDTAGFSNQTVQLRFDTTDYPDTTADGSSIYEGAEQVYTHEGLTPGQTNYYTVFLSHDGASWTNPP